MVTHKVNKRYLGEIQAEVGFLGVLSYALRNLRLNSDGNFS